MPPLRDIGLVELNGDYQEHPVVPNTSATAAECQLR